MTRFFKVAPEHAANRTSAPRKGKRAKRSMAGLTKDALGSNGLSGFAIHGSESTKKTRKAFRSINAGGPIAPTIAPNPRRVASLDPEAAARGYLERAFASSDVRQFVRPAMKAVGARAAVQSEFKSLGAEAVPLAGTTAVKFRQMFNQIPVYGSLVTVELGDDNECIGINSSLGNPDLVPHVATVAPATALALAAKASGQRPMDLSSTPRLYYYYHTDKHWHLAYIIEDVPQRVAKKASRKPGDALRKDFVVDALTGRMLAQLPRTPTMAVVNITAIDGLNRKRKLTVERIGVLRRELRDTALNLATYDFAFKDPSAQDNLLPGALVNMPPSPIPPEAVGAHANAGLVAKFLRNVLQRNNIDNRGGAMLSSVNCWDRGDGTVPPKEWLNAFWNGEQMVYGQVRFPDGSFFSIANMTDIVGHEMFHGVTDSTSRLEYQTQPGALNESYSDIFGIIIANQGRALGRWVWRLGESFNGPGTALRDMQDPERFGQPKHMRNFKTATPPYTYQRNDYGHVHTNSGIHNFAAYSVMTAKAGRAFLFKGKDIAAMFYIALTVHLSRTSQFSDSRRAVVQAARSLFRNDAAAARNRKIAAVEDGFSAAGIV